jgi:hypothetical protein
MKSEIPLARKVSIINMSSGGVLVKTDRRLNIGNTYLLKIGYKDNLLFARAAVKWSFLVQSYEDENGNIVPQYMAGMHFKEVSSGKNEGIIESIISDLEADLSQFLTDAESDGRGGYRENDGETAVEAIGKGTDSIRDTADL